MINIFPLSLTLALSLFISPAFGQELSPAPNYRDGDSWLFNAVEKGTTSSSTKALDGDYRVFFKRSDVRVALVGQEKSQVQQGVAQLKRLLATTDDEKFLQFPLALNSKWSADFHNDSRAGVSQSVHADMTVLGYEEVTTKAGKFNAFKIQRTESSGRSRKVRHHVECVYYYRPETRSIVKYHRDEQGGATRDFELIALTPAK